MPDHIKNALCTTFDRYSTYLNSFGPDESYLRKKVETELGAKMIHLKMRCSGLGAEWGKVYHRIFPLIIAYLSSNLCMAANGGKFINELLRCSVVCWLS